MILIATGSEVEIALDAAARLEAQGHRRRRRLHALHGALRRAAAGLSRGHPAGRRNREILRVSIEAGTTFGWERYTGLHGLRIGIDRFGVSAPGHRMPTNYFGLTPDRSPSRVARLHEDKEELQ